MNIEHVKQKKVQEAEEFFKMLRIDDNFLIAPPYQPYSDCKVEKGKVHWTRLSNNTTPFLIIE